MIHIIRKCSWNWEQTCNAVCYVTIWSIIVIKVCSDDTVNNREITVFRYCKWVARARTKFWGMVVDIWYPNDNCGHIKLGFQQNVWLAGLCRCWVCLELHHINWNCIQILCFSIKWSFCRHNSTSWIYHETIISNATRNLIC